MVVRPARTIDALAAEPRLRWAVIVACLPVLQGWGNMLLHAAFGLDWLGTRPNLSDPTYIGGFGYVQLGLEHWVPIFAALLPLLSLLGLVVVPGLMQLLSRLWNGQGTFEQMVVAWAFASVAPGLIIGATSEWLFGVPVNLLTGHDYWWAAAMGGELGPLVGVVWNVYGIGVYSVLQYGWMLTLGVVALRRIQRIPLLVAVAIMLFSLVVWMALILASFVR